MRVRCARPGRRRVGYWAAPATLRTRRMRRSVAGFSPGLCAVFEIWISKMFAELFLKYVIECISKLEKRKTFLIYRVSSRCLRIDYKT